MSKKNSSKGRGGKAAASDKPVAVEQPVVEPVAVEQPTPDLTKQFGVGEVVDATLGSTRGTATVMAVEPKQIVIKTAEGKSVTLKRAGDSPVLTYKVGKTQFVAVLASLEPTADYDNRADDVTDAEVKEISETAKAVDEFNGAEQIIIAGNTTGPNFVPMMNFTTRDAARKYATAQGGSDFLVDLRTGEAELFDVQNDVGDWRPVNVGVIVAKLYGVAIEALIKAAAGPARAARSENGSKRTGSKRTGSKSKAAAEPAKPWAEGEKIDRDKPFGFSVCQLVRGLGHEGFDIGAIKVMVKDLHLHEPSNPTTLPGMVRAGKLGRDYYGPVPGVHIAPLPENVVGFLSKYKSAQGTTAAQTATF